MHIKEIELEKIIFSIFFSFLFVLIINFTFKSLKYILNTYVLGIIIIIYILLLNILFTLLILTYFYKINDKNKSSLNKIKFIFNDLTLKLKYSIYKLFINLIITIIIFFLITINISRITQIKYITILIFLMPLTYFNIESIFYSFKELYIYLKNN